MSSTFKRILILFCLAVAVICRDASDSPDTPPVLPKCSEPKTYWNGWNCECPVGTNFSEDKCVECTHGRIWDSFYENCKCPTEDQDFNSETNLCECSGGRIFNETAVTCDCTFGRMWDLITEECKCPRNDQTWNHEQNICECSNGRVWNSVKKECECSAGRSWESTEEACVCEDSKIYDDALDECICQGGKTWNTEENECACPTNLQWNGTVCETKDKSCEIGRKWNGIECVLYCQKYEELVEESCQSRCHRNELWDGDKNRCILDCEEGEVFDDYFNRCHVKCEENQIWNDDSEECISECSSGQHLVEGKCVCGEGFKFNGLDCEEIKETPSTCTEGYTLGDDNKCYQSVPINCPAGYENVDNRCEKKKVTTINCPKDFIYDEYARKCLQAIDPVCPSGSVLINGECVESVTIRPTCPIGYQFLIDKCVKIQEPSCPEGYDKRNGGCFKKVVCTESQQLKDGICIEIQCPVGYVLNNRVCEIPKNENCPDGYVLEDGKCKRKIDSKCPDGFTLVEETCRRNVDDKCPKGFLLEGGICKRNIDDKCPEGLTLVEGTCRPGVEVKCPEGFILHDGTCKRKTIEDCPPGYASIEGICRRILDPNCPDGLTLINGTCTHAVNDNCPSGYILIDNICTRETVHDCPQGYVLVGGVCKPEIIEPEACPEWFHRENGKCVSNGSGSLTSPCEDDEIIINGKCFKVICPNGFVILENRCIEVSCPEGFVWFEGSCKTAEESGSGAVFEINNYIYNHVTRNLTGTPIIPIQNTNVVNVYVEGNNNCDGDICASDVDCEDGADCNIQGPEVEIIETTFKPPALVHTTSSPVLPTPPPAALNTTLGPKQNCCRIITPRVCKKYDDKWLCYNKNFQDCSEFCVKPVVYLKPPKVIYKPPVLIVPPNPPLESCQYENCEGPKIDCSGCSEYQKDTCSSYCYDYHCVNRDCTYFNQEEYCKKYPFSIGCTYNFGCIGDWCTGNH